MGGAVTAGRDSGFKSRDGLVRFGRLLAEALRLRGMKQDDLGVLLGTTQSSVSGWINGKYEPAATTVFRIERALALEPGHLSRPLGYLPVDAAATPESLEGAILRSTELDDEEKDALVALYLVLARRRRAAKKPVAAVASRLRAARSATGAR